MTTRRCPYCGDAPPVDEYERVNGALIILSAVYCCRAAADADADADADDPYDDAGHEARMIAYAAAVGVA